MASIARQEEYSANVVGTTVTTTFKQTPTQGNLLVCVYGGKISDANLTGPGAGWTKAVSRQASVSLAAGMWYKIAGAAEATAVVCTQAGAAAPQWVQIYEYPGVTATPLDVTASNSSAGAVVTLATGTTLATAQADELVIAAWQTNDPAGRLSSVTDSFEPELASNLGDPALFAAAKVVSATGTQTSTGTWTTSNACVGLIATFKLSAAPSTSGQRIRRLVSGKFTTAENSTGTVTTGSFTPTQGKLLLAFVGCSNDSATDVDSTIAASHGGTLAWTLVRSYVGTQGLARRVHVFRALASSAPGAGTIAITTPQTATAVWFSVVEVDGTDTSGTQGSGAIVQSAVGNSGVGATSVTVTQAAAPAAASSIVGICLHGTAQRQSRESTYRLINEGQCADKGQQVSAVWLNGADQTTTWTWATSSHSVAIAVEIKAGSTITPSSFTGAVTAELNRLAGTTGKAMAGAANAWAGTTGLDTVGALNTKAGNARTAWKDLQGVCNQLAGTTGLGAPEALARYAG